MNLKTNFRRLGMTLFVFCLPMILFIAILLASYYKTGELYWSASVSKATFYFVVVSLITIPGFLLHCNYYLYDKGKKLTFESTHIELSNHLQTSKIYFKDIQKVEIHSLLWHKKLPWKNYGYTAVILKNGESLKFTTLLVDTMTSKVYFDSANTIVEEVEDFYTWIK